MHLTDPVYTPREHHRAWERVALRFIQDPRDLPFVKVIVAAWAVLGTSSVLLFVESPFRWWHAAIHLALIYGVFFPPAVLMLHNTSHRALFRPRYRWLKFVIPWLVTPFCGVTPETYFAHHIGMHHVEDNLPGDLSSTMKYQRDSFVDFLRYFGSFITTGVPRLSLYFYRRKRFKLMRNLLVGELSYLVIAAAATWLNWRAALVAFWIPLVATRFCMMLGNWAQHAFLDRASPENNFRSAATCVNSRFNHAAFNDGYHIGHHLKSSMHWTDMPGELLKNESRYAQEGAIVFEGLDWGMVWLLLMTKSYRALARRVVPLDGRHLPLEETIELLRSRTAAIALEARPLAGAEAAGAEAAADPSPA
jgi:hypothetical protein